MRDARRRAALPVAVAFAALALGACAGGPLGESRGREGLAPEQTRVVRASAYNAVRAQTSEQPWIAAWGDRLEPESKAIAVSRDLLALGLTRGTKVRIDGLPGEYVVLDKMARRWRNKIDIFMGEDVEAARRWGVREVRIRWRATDR